MIALGGPLLCGRRLGRVRLVAHLHGERRNAGADEAVLVASNEPVALGFGIRLDRQLQFGGHGANVGRQIRFVEAEHHQRLERKQRQEHVGVDVGDKRAGWHGRVCDVVPGAKLALLLTGDGEEQNRARPSLARLAKAGGHLEDRRHAGRVVHRAVVDAVARHRLADADMIEMRRHDDEFVAQIRVGAAQDAGDVLRFDRSE